MAGGLQGRGLSGLEQAAATLEQAGHKVSMAPTTGPGTAGGIALQAVRAGADLILVAGGDGTVNEALNGMLPGEVPLAILPCGTANVLSKELRIGSSMPEAAGRLAEWVPRRISVGVLRARWRAVSRYFLLMAGAGFDAHLVNSVDPGLKNRHGKLAYWITGFREAVRRWEEFNVRIDGRDYLCSFALASRVRNYGGTFEIARHASLVRDDFAIVLFEGSSALRYSKYLAGVMTGRLDGMKGVRILRSQSIELYGPSDQRVYVQVDGEAAGRLPATIEIVPRALTLLAPPHFTG